MDVFDTIAEMMHVSGLSFRAVENALERSHGYLGSILYKRRIPSTVVLARIADACGYDLLVRRRADDEEIIIDPYDND